MSNPHYAKALRFGGLFLSTLWGYLYANARLSLLSLLLSNVQKTMGTPKTSYLSHFTLWGGCVWGARLALCPDPAFGGTGDDK